MTLICYGIETKIGNLNCPVILEEIYKKKSLFIWEKFFDPGFALLLLLIKLGHWLQKCFVGTLSDLSSEFIYNQGHDLYSTLESQKNKSGSILKSKSKKTNTKIFRYFFIFIVFLDGSWHINCDIFNLKIDSKYSKNVFECILVG